jgi:hypothetical protein
VVVAALPALVAPTAGVVGVAAPTAGVVGVIAPAAGVVGVAAPAAGVVGVELAGDDGRLTVPAAERTGPGPACPETGPAAIGIDVVDAGRVVDVVAA